MRMLDHKRNIFILFIFVFWVSQLFANINFIGKKYIADSGHYITFNTDFVIEDYWTEEDGWSKTIYSYDISNENSYLVLYLNNNNSKEKYYVFSFEDKHMILFDCKNKYELHLTLYNKNIDEAYLIPVYNCSASSSYTEIINSNVVNYSPENIKKGIDCNWVEGVSGNGIDEFISFTVPGEHGVLGIYFVNGFFSPEKTDLYYDNNRVKTINILTYDKDMNIVENFDYILKDTGQPQKISLSKVAKNFVLTIKEVYSGRKYEDTAITAIFVDGLSLY